MYVQLPALAFLSLRLCEFMTMRLRVWIMNLGAPQSCLYIPTLGASWVSYVEKLTRRRLNTQTHFYRRRSLHVLCIHAGQFWILITMTRHKIDNKVNNIDAQCVYALKTTRERKRKALKTDRVPISSSFNVCRCRGTANV